jgi:hypothetical protein
MVARGERAAARRRAADRGRVRRSGDCAGRAGARRTAAAHQRRGAAALRGLPGWFTILSGRHAGGDPRAAAGGAPIGVDEHVIRRLLRGPRQSGWAASWSSRSCSISSSGCACSSTAADARGCVSSNRRAAGRAHPPASRGAAARIRHRPSAPLRWPWSRCPGPMAPATRRRARGRRAAGAPRRLSMSRRHRRWSRRGTRGTGPDFRGSDRRRRIPGGAAAGRLAGGGLTPIWKQPVGGGYASFSVAAGAPSPSSSAARGGGGGLRRRDRPRALDRHGLDGEFREVHGRRRPARDARLGRRLVYALGATGELRALDEATGPSCWRTNILDDNGRDEPQWGMAASPLVVDDLLIVLPGGRAGSVVAYDRRTGAPLVRARRQAGVRVADAGDAGRRPAAARGERRAAVGLSRRGRRAAVGLPWPGPNDINAAQPLVVDDRRVFVSSGYGMGAAMIELTPRGRPLLRARGVAQQPDEEPVRQLRAARRVHLRARRVDPRLHGRGDRRAEVWKGGRYGYGQLLLAGGHLIVLTEDGDLALVRATPERHDELVRFRVLTARPGTRRRSMTGSCWCGIWPRWRPSTCASPDVRDDPGARTPVRPGSFNPFACIGVQHDFHPLQRYPTHEAVTASRSRAGPARRGCPAGRGRRRVLAARRAHRAGVGRLDDSGRGRRGEVLAALARAVGQGLVPARLRGSLVSHRERRLEGRRCPAAATRHPIVWGDRIFLTTAYDGGQRLSVLAFNRSSGEKLWETFIPSGRVEHVAPEERARVGHALDRRRAHLRVVRPSRGLLALDLDGEIVWHRGSAPSTTTTAPRVAAALPGPRHPLSGSGAVPTRSSPPSTPEDGTAGVAHAARRERRLGHAGRHPRRRSRRDHRQRPEPRDGLRPRHRRELWRATG